MTGVRTKPTAISGNRPCFCTHGRSPECDFTAAVVRATTETFHGEINLTAARIGDAATILTTRQETCSHAEHLRLHRKLFRTCLSKKQPDTVVWKQKSGKKTWIRQSEPTSTTLLTDALVAYVPNFVRIFSSYRTTLYSACIYVNFTCKLINLHTKTCPTKN